MANDGNFKTVGAFWKPEKGKKYVLNGVANEDIPKGTKLYVFPNKYKNKEQDPEYSISGKFAGRTSPRRNEPRESNSWDNDVGDDDIPF